MPAVITENRGQLETGQDPLSPWAVEHRGNHHFVSLVELRKTSIEIDVGRVLRAVVTVEIGRRIDRFAVSVVSEYREVVAEPLLDFQDSTLIQGIPLGAVLVVLNHQGIHEAGNRRI